MTNAFQGDLDDGMSSVGREQARCGPRSDGGPGLSGAHARAGQTRSGPQGEYPASDRDRATRSAVFLVRPVIAILTRPLRPSHLQRTESVLHGRGGDPLVDARSGGLPPGSSLPPTPLPADPHRCIATMQRCSSVGGREETAPTAAREIVSEGRCVGPSASHLALTTRPSHGRGPPGRGPSGRARTRRQRPGVRDGGADHRRRLHRGGPSSSWSASSRSSVPMSRPSSRSPRVTSLRRVDDG
jgi:hypothetical protein